MSIPSFRPQSYRVAIGHPLCEEMYLEVTATSAGEAITAAREIAASDTRTLPLDWYPFYAMPYEWIDEPTERH